jgi:hypothetical protein
VTNQSNLPENESGQTSLLRAMIDSVQMLMKRINRLNRAVEDVLEYVSIKPPRAEIKSGKEPEFMKALYELYKIRFEFDPDEPVEDEDASSP